MRVTHSIRRTAADLRQHFVYRAPMSLLCYFGRHKPSTSSLSRGKHGGYAALCEACSVPLERADKGSWRAAEPLDSR